jgi:quercetin dioxygenase-like cupin family protein
MTDPRKLPHVQRRAEVEPSLPPGWTDRASGFGVTPLVGGHVGSVHTGWALCALEPSGHVDPHLHSFEQSVYVVAGNPLLTTGGRTYRLSPHECGLLPVAASHAWSNDGAEIAVWLEVSAPAPRLSGPPDTFWTGAGEPPATVGPPRRSGHGPRQPEDRRRGRRPDRVGEHGDCAPGV